MNPQKKPSMSSLDKIQALKKDQELKRQTEAESIKIKKEQEEQEKVIKYDDEKQELSKMSARRDEILKKLAEIKSRRDEIITTGHKSVEEAKKDQEVEKILRTNEGFEEIFGTEKAEWQELRDEVIALNEELKNLEIKIHEKEKQVETLFAETPEGKKEKEEELTKKFIRETPSLNEIEKGNLWISVKEYEFEKLSLEEKSKTKETILSYLEKQIDQQFNEANKRSGLEDVKEDVERVKKFIKERNEILLEIEQFRQEAQNYKQKYDNLFQKNEEIKDIIYHYGLNTETLTYFESYSNKKPDDQLFETLKSFQNDDINKEVLDPKKTKEYIEKAREFNNKLIDIIEKNDVETIKKIFEREGLEKYFGFSIHNQADNLYFNYKKPLIKSQASKKLNLPFPELEDYYNKKIENQQKEKEIIKEGFKASIDMELLANTKNIIEIIQRDLEKIKENKKGVENFISSLNFYRNRLRDKLDEEIVFESKILGRTFAYPKFSSEVKEIDNYVSKIQNVEESLKNLRKKAKELQDKKLGIFEIKSKHEEKVNEAWKKVRDLEMGEYESLRNSLNYILNKKNDDLVEIWNMNKWQKLGLYNKLNFREPIKLNDALTKIEAELLKIKEVQFPKDKVELLKKYKEAEQKFEKAKRDILALQKK